MASIIAWLDGKKTYITAVLIALFNFGVAQGWWAEGTMYVELVNAILAAFGLAFLRSGVKKSE